MTTSDVERLATESYNQLRPSGRGQFREIEVSPTTITINENKIQNIIPIDAATLAPPARFAERQIVDTPNGPVDI